jgi:hypothetical protein
MTLPLEVVQMEVLAAAVQKPAEHLEALETRHRLLRLKETMEALLLLPALMLVEAVAVRQHLARMGRLEWVVLEEMEPHQACLVRR